MSKAWKAVVAVAFIGLTLVGLAVYLGYSASERVKSVAAWPTVPGYVVESAIVWDVTSSDSAPGRSRSHSHRYLLTVRTDYMVGGNYYSSNTPAVYRVLDQKHGGTNPREAAPDEDIISLFKQVPQGTLVPVHYNPENHAEGYIFTDVPFWELYKLPFFVALFGVFLLLVATGIGFADAYSG